MATILNIIPPPRLPADSWPTRRRPWCAALRAALWRRAQPPAQPPAPPRRPPPRPAPPPVENPWPWMMLENRRPWPQAQTMTLLTIPATEPTK
jgi:hypothetical protein